MWRTRRVAFKVSRNGFPIEQVWLKDAVNTGIQYETLTFPLWEAAIAAGATLDELAHLDDYPPRFLAKLIAWYQKHNIVKLHEQDAMQRAMERKQIHKQGH